MVPREKVISQLARNDPDYRVLSLKRKITQIMGLYVGMDISFPTQGNTVLVHLCGTHRSTIVFFHNDA